MTRMMRARILLMSRCGRVVAILVLFATEAVPFCFHSVPITRGISPKEDFVEKSMFSRIHDPSASSHRQPRTSALQVQLSDTTPSASTPSTSPLADNSDRQKPVSSLSAQLAAITQTCQLIGASLILAITIIAWEEISTTHPMRSYVSPESYFGSTVRGMGFGAQERQKMTLDIEPESLLEIRSYNEIMFQHRSKRVSTWNDAITKQDVERSVRTLQLALLQVLDCQHLASEYEWETLSKKLREPILLSQLDQACDTLNRAKEFLSQDARSEIGFDFGSCAWRHCGAFADVREAIDELDHLIGILEPFEANFVLDVVERALRDMLAVTTEYQDKSIHIPEYQQLQRRSEMYEDIDEALDVDYLAALEFLKSIEQ